MTDEQHRAADSGTKSERGSAVKKFFSVIGALACDAIIAFGGAWILWMSSSITVADAPAMSYVIVILTTAFLVLVRHAILGRSGHSAAVIETVLVGDVVLTAVVAVFWQLQSDYFLGWVACYSAVLLLVMGVFELFGIAAGRSGTAVKNVARADFIRLFVIIGAIAGLVVTSSVHAWNLRVLNAALLTAAVGIAVGAVGRSVLFRGSASAPEQGDEAESQDEAEAVEARSLESDTAEPGASKAAATDSRGGEATATAREPIRRRTSESRTVDASTV